VCGVCGACKVCKVCVVKYKINNNVDNNYCRFVRRDVTVILCNSEWAWFASDTLWTQLSFSLSLFSLSLFSLSLSLFSLFSLSLSLDVHCRVHSSSIDGGTTHSGFG